MEYRELGRTGWRVSAVSLGCWAIGGSWGPVDDGESMAALHRAAELGVNFFDTSDRYGDGRSERLLARLRRERDDEIIIATKIGRRLDPHVAEGYNLENLTSFVERCLVNLDTDALDLVPKKAAGTAAGLTGLFGYFGGAFAANITIGAAVDHFGWNGVSGSSSAAAWHR